MFDCITEVIKQKLQIVDRNLNFNLNIQRILNIAHVQLVHCKVTEIFL